MHITTEFHGSLVLTTISEISRKFYRQEITSSSEMFLMMLSLILQMPTAAQITNSQDEIILLAFGSSDSQNSTSLCTAVYMHGTHSRKCTYNLELRNLGDSL